VLLVAIVVSVVLAKRIIPPIVLLTPNSVVVLSKAVVLVVSVVPSRLIEVPIVLLPPNAVIGPSKVVVRISFAKL
jgi:hypothetical protein